MKVRVDEDMCDLHAQCVFAAPEVFRLNDAGELEYETEVSDDLADKLRSAQSLCPAAAIELLP